MAKQAIPSFDLTEQYGLIEADVMAAVERVLKSGHYILGPEVNAFESELAGYLGVRHAIGVANGSDALLLALMALGIQPGDEVLIPTFTFFATAGAVARLGAVPVFCNIDLNTFNLDPAELEKRLTAKTRAIIPVHLYGQVADMDAIMNFARQHGLSVIEDAAQAIGASYRGKTVCNFGDIGCLSFYPTKNLGACGDAGMVVTNDDPLAEKLRILRTHGSKKKYHHDVLGFNSRLDELQAAILRVKLNHLDDWMAKRQAIAAYYDQALSDSCFGGKVIAPQVAAGNRHVYHQYTIRAEQRDALIAALAANGIGSTVYYPLCLHLQPVFAHLGRQPGDCPQAEKATETALSLPMYPELDQASQRRVIETIRAFVQDQH